MDSLVSTTRRRRRLLLALAASAAAGYGLYRLYHHPAVSRHRRRLGALLSLAGTAASTADTLSLISSDLDAFLRSDSDDIPRSLLQLSKLAASDHFAVAASRIAESLTSSVLRGLAYSSSDPNPHDSEHGGFQDRILDRILSPAGSGFASAVVGSFARNLVIAYTSGGGKATGDGEPEWLSVLCSVKGKEAVAELVRVFVSTAVAVYLDRTVAVNTCDEILASITNPKHEGKVKDLVVSVCNGAVETLVRTSRQVTAAAAAASASSIARIDPIRAQEVGNLNSCSVQRGADNNEWVKRVSTTLAVPSNRRLVLDVTGRVTAETVRSFLDFLSQRVSDGARKSISIARDEIVESGLVAVKYLSAKSMAIFTVCLALCMHVSIGTRLLLPA